MKMMRDQTLPEWLRDPHDKIGTLIFLEVRHDKTYKGWICKVNRDDYEMYRERVEITVYKWVPHDVAPLEELIECR